jgi:hypothetical protein
MNPSYLKKMSYWMVILILGICGTRCATPQKELRTYPLTEINLENVFRENRGLKVLPENATMIHDYYRGGVQEKEEGEKLIKDGRWEDAGKHLLNSNRYLQVVIKYLPEDEPQRNVYGDVMVIFLPNLLIADNNLKLVTVYRKTGNDLKVAEAKSAGLYYLEASLKSVRTEWASQIKQGLGEDSPKK